VRYPFTSWLDFLLIFVPTTIVLELLRADPLLVFISAGLAIIPLQPMSVPASVRCSMPRLAMPLN
jgi:Ca2+/H+ antiporter